MKRITLILLSIVNVSLLFAYDFYVDGIYYNMKESNTVSVTCYSKDEYFKHDDKEYKGDIVIPESIEVYGKRMSVVEIGEHAFYFCYHLNSVSIPNSVKTIGEEAFEHCFNLKSIYIPSSVISISRGSDWWPSQPFESCSNLESIVVDSENPVFDSRDSCNAIIETKTGTLVSCCKNTVIPYSVLRIGTHAYTGCDMKKVTIPKNIAEIEDGAFYFCDEIESIEVDVENRYYDSRNGCNAIIETKSGKLIKGCCNTIVPFGVTSIGEDAFLSTYLKRILIPSSVASLDRFAFSCCKGLNSVVIPPSVKEIQYGSFFNIQSLDSVFIVESCKVDRDAFINSENIKYLSVPKGFNIVGLKLPKGVKVVRTPNVKPKITVDSIQYISCENDTNIHAGSKGKLRVYIRNSSFGKAKKAVMSISKSGSSNGILIKNRVKLGDVYYTDGYWVEIPVVSRKNIKNGKVDFVVKISENKGTKSNVAKKSIEILSSK